jgi:hypothetical protein
MGFGVRWPWDLVAMGFGGRGLLAQSDVCDGPPIEALVGWLVGFFFFFFGYEMEICGWVRCVAGMGFVFVLLGGFVFSDHLSCADLLCGSEIVSGFGFMVVL